MTTSRAGLSVVALLLALIAGAAAGADVLKERRWASQLSASLPAGTAVTLTADGREFLALYTPATGDLQRGGVILLHGLDAHPDWPQVIAPLRTGLPPAGWATLAPQLPLLPDDASLEEYLALFPEAAARISAAIEFLQQQGILNITLVGHGLGAAQGAQFLAAGAAGSAQVRAFVGIGLGALPGTVAHAPDHLAKIRVPVLDLYGARDLAPVLSSSEERAAAARAAGNGGYRQTEVMGADHFFRGLNDTLVTQVGRWLTRVAPSATLTPATPAAGGR